MVFLDPETYFFQMVSMNKFLLRTNQNHTAKKLTLKVQKKSFWPIFIFISCLDAFDKIFAIFPIYLSADNFFFHVSFFNSAKFSYFMSDHNLKIALSCFFGFLHKGYFFGKYRLFRFFRQNQYHIF
jgi:hypothetical protein